MDADQLKVKTLLFWIFGGLGSIILGTVIGIFYWTSAESNGNLDLLSEIKNSVISLPVGWLFCMFVPFSWVLTLMSWLSIFLFALACYLKSIKILMLVYVACFVFGLFWPLTLWGIMSV